MTGAVRKLSIVAAAFATACVYTSPSPVNDPATGSPLGARAEITAGRDQYTGELLAITAADFTLLTDRRVVVIPFDVAGIAHFRSVGIGTYGAPWPSNAEQLKYASRFPEGIPPSALDAILRTRGQTAPDTIRLSRR